jgi:tRNA U38,U39,U40 pseudouridine synthase TruA
MTTVTKPYMSTKCALSDRGPHHHEDCVTGPDYNDSTMRETCQCSCHDKKRNIINCLVADGFTHNQIRHIGQILTYGRVLY